MASAPAGQSERPSLVIGRIDAAPETVFQAWTKVTIRLEPAGSGTRLVLRHERFFDPAARASHQCGGTSTFRKLDRFLQETAAR